MAGRVRRIGGTTIRSFSHVSHPRSSEDDNDKFVQPGEMMRRLMENNRQTVRKVRPAHKVTDERRDYPSSDPVESVLDGAEGLIWYLYKIIQSRENPA
jgi:starvation-inducible DNA-binding protein